MKTIRQILLLCVALVGLVLIPAHSVEAASLSEEPGMLQPAATALNADEDFAHGGGLNACGCHFNRKTGECHCHQNRGCGCECQSSSCPSVKPEVPREDIAASLISN